MTMLIAAAIVLFLNAAFNVFAWPRFFARVAKDPRARTEAGKPTPFFVVHAVLLAVALALAVASVIGGVALLVTA